MGWLLVLILAGCDTFRAAESTASERDGDTDADGDTDNNGTIDTGTALLWYEARVQTTDGVMTGGRWGTIFTDSADPASFDDPLCENVGTWTWGGDAPSVCPDCDWAFYILTTDTVAEGPRCADFGRVGGEWDGFDHSWGFSERYLYRYAGYEILLEDVFWYYYDAGGYWLIMSYSYGAGGYGHPGEDATDVLARWRYDASYSYLP